MNYSGTTNKITLKRINEKLKGIEWHKYHNP